MTSELRPLRIVSACVATALSVVSCWVGADLLGQSLESGNLGLLAAGLAVTAVGVVAAGAVGWLAWMELRGEPSSSEIAERRMKILISALAGLSGLGLGWLAVTFAVDGRSGLAWLMGGLALLIFGLWFIRLVEEAWTAPDAPTLVEAGVVVLAELGLGWLAVTFAVDGRSGLAWLMGGLAILFLVFAGWCGGVQFTNSWQESLAEGGFVVAPVAILSAVVARLATDGHPIFAGLVGGLALAVLVLQLWAFERLPDMGWLRRRGRTWRTTPLQVPPGGAVSLLARALGLAIPLATLVWAIENKAQSRSGVLVIDVLVGAAELGIAAVAMLLVQGLGLVWLRPGPQPRLMEKAVEITRHSAEAELSPDGGHWRTEDPVGGRGGGRLGSGPPDHGPWEEDGPRRRRGSLSIPSPYFSVFKLLARPLDPPAAVRVNLEAITATGLIPDAVWPRIKLVVPPEVGREVNRSDKIVAMLRVTASSAICTALVWISTAVLLSYSRPNSVELALLLLGPLSIALAALLRARRRVTDAYLRRAEAVELYRFDLAKAMHLPQPSNNAQLIALGGVLSGEEPAYDFPIAWSHSAQPADPTHTSEYRRGLAVDVSRRVAEDIRALLRHQYEELRLSLPAVELDPRQLRRLAEEIAEFTSDPISADLKQHMADLHGQLNKELHHVIQASIKESVLGPPLANFTGYLMIELGASEGDDASARTVDGTIVARAGCRLNLNMSVVRDDRARNVASAVESDPNQPFFAFEPINIDGGRDDVAIVEFDAMVDSVTLTPLPQRYNLRVLKGAQKSFGFRLPQQESRHEVWFQLYQSGRLIQVVAVTIVASIDPAEGAG
ncbi:hypothetical protein [Streptomyces sp. NBC_01006]|uniref:hypothetical protein n=1 Tax=Streptomyces sp. NBC_01006 TaxID=2903716 RepID=UPI002F90B213|nr:hypothetical protein OG509_39925 [Streptomyces sp. NBC_01006]